MYLTLLYAVAQVLVVPMLIVNQSTFPLMSAGPNNTMNTLSHIRINVLPQIVIISSYNFAIVLAN